MYDFKMDTDKVTEDRPRKELNAPSSSSSCSSDGNYFGGYISLNSDYFETTTDDKARATTDVPKPEFTLMIQVSKTKARMTLLTEDGKVQPLQNENRNGKYSTPFWMSLVKMKFFAFGPSVLTYAERAKDDNSFRRNCLFWDVGDLIQSDTEWKKSLILVNGKFFAVHIEVLVGLFINYLKSVAEVYTETAIKQVVFCVPLWFGILHRQRLKDSALIAGFEKVSVVNETSTIAYLHHSSKNPSFQHILVLSENSGHVELGFYRSLSGTAMEMVACSSNLFQSSNIHAYRRKKIFKPYKSYFNNDAKIAFLTSLLGSLLDEIMEKSHMKALPDCTELLLFCEDREWKMIFERKMAKPVIMYEHLGAPPVVLNSDHESVPNNFWTPPYCNLGDLFNSSVTDLMPLGLYRSDLMYGNQTIKLLDHFAKLNKATVIKTVSFYPTTTTTVYQKNFHGQELQVGTLDILSTLCFQYASMETKLTLETDGTVHLNSVCAFNELGNPVRMLKCPEEFSWTPTNLSVANMEKASEDLKEIMRLSNKYRDDIMTRRETLWRLCHEVSEKMFYGEMKRRWRERRGEMEEMVRNDMDMLMTKDPLVDFRVSQLQQLLNSLRRCNELYFF